tara:strand:- start:904 stop:1500 length:597 start_codon:yes stop_codon:yes gene_type:complete
MAKFHTKRFEKEVAKTLRSQAIKEKARIVAEDKVRRAHKEMLQDFDTHSVTREIKSGPEGTNLSGTLGGYGNLFSYIGFDRGSQPTESIRTYLEKQVHVFKEPRVLKTVGGAIFSFRLTTPNLDTIQAMTPSPWENRSWVKGLESGISGLGFYLFSRKDDFNTRSESGIQKTQQLRSLSFRPIKYMSSILEKFYRNTR